MNDKALVSIVIPVYNAADYIEDTIKTVLGQTYQNWEIIVVNDCSTDNTKEILENYQHSNSKIKLVDLDYNRGAPAAPRNIGVKIASGSLIAFLDSDDLWHPEKLKIQVEALSSAGARFCSTEMVNFKSGKEPTLNCNTLNKIKRISFLHQLIKYQTPTSSVLVEKDLLINYPFNEDMSYKAREDLDCWLHCHEEIDSSIKIMSPLMGYRLIDGQISGKKWVMVKRHFYVLKNYRKLSGRFFSYPEAFLFTFTHFTVSLYYRFVKRGL